MILDGKQKTPLNKLNKQQKKGIQQKRYLINSGCRMRSFPRVHMHTHGHGLHIIKLSLFVYFSRLFYMNFHTHKKKTEKERCTILKNYRNNSYCADECERLNGVRTIWGRYYLHSLKLFHFDIEVLVDELLVEFSKIF